MRRMWRMTEAPISVEGKKGYFDVAYDSQSKKQKLDIWLPEGDGPFPVIATIHGGGFVALDKRSGEQGKVRSGYRQDGNLGWKCRWIL